MKIYDLFKLCVSNLWKRKLRSVLTVLGVMIGTTSIVVMISIGVGLENIQEEQISSYMDITTIQVYRTWGDENAAKLDEESLGIIKKIDHVKAATPYFNYYFDVGDYSNYRMTSGRYTYSGSVYVVDLSMMADLGYELADGRWPTAKDENVIMFNENGPYNFIDSTKETWSSGAYDSQGNKKPLPVDPLRKRISMQVQYNQFDETGNLKTYSGDIRQHKLTSPGIIKGDSSKDYGQAIAYIDYKFFANLKEEYYKVNGLKMTNNDKMFDQVYVKVDDIENVADVEAQIKELGFDTWSAEQMRGQMSDMMQTVQLVLGALGAVSMLVAAIGIANTMVMSIYERTREIGVMKVIGCRLGDIRAMFLTEAACIGMIGGICGLILSHSLSIVVNIVMSSMMGSTGDISQIPLWLDLLGFGFSILVGIISGISPANRAVKISALSAIRQE